MGITVRHCSIYEASRAGINISEGTFGGHLIEFCDVFDTVRETGDHGSFNSWGRDRFWGLKDAPAGRAAASWRCWMWSSRTSSATTAGAAITAGTSTSTTARRNYEIYNNLFLHGGLKLREGFHRTVWNNIAVNNSLPPARLVSTTAATR